MMVLIFILKDDDINVYKIFLILKNKNIFSKQINCFNI